jgi:hypothetical protein
MTVYIKKLIFLLLTLYSSLGLCQDQYLGFSDNPKKFQLDTTSIIKDGDYVVFKYKDDYSPCTSCLFDYFIYTLRSQCNDTNIELINEEGQDHSDSQLKSTFTRNYLGKKYEPNKPFDLMTKYACSKANEIPKSNKNSQLSPIVEVKKSQDDEAHKLCKSYGLKKGTKDYVDCMLKIREQDLNKEAKLQKNIEDAARTEQNLVDEKNKKQLEDIKAAQEKRNKDEQDAAMRVDQQRAYQLQQIRSRCDNARQNMGMFCAQANQNKDNPYSGVDVSAVWECSRWRNEVSKVCR